MTQNKYIKTKSEGSYIVDFDEKKAKFCLSTQNVVDSINEMNLIGSFSDFIAKNKNANGETRTAFLREHDFNLPIARVDEIFEEADKLYTVVEFGKTDIAKNAVLDIKSNILKECSTGCRYNLERGEYKMIDGVSIYCISYNAIVEGSMTVVGKNPITGLATKSEQDILKIKSELIDALVTLSKEAYSGGGTDERLYEIEMHKLSVLQRLNDVDELLAKKSEKQENQLYNELELKLIQKIENFKY